MFETRTDIVIRRATASDERALWRLAALDSAPAPLAGPDVLIAEVAGEPVAAIAGDGVVADPFRPTAAIVELLRVRARQLDPAQGAPARLRPRRRRSTRAVPARPLPQS